MEKPLETPVKEVVPKPVQEAVVTQEQGEQPNIFKKFWYVFLIFGVVIVFSLVVLVYGYLKLNQEKSVPTPTSTPTPTVTEEVDEQTSALEEQGTSDVIEDIETDLEATDLSEIDQELEDIESELESP